MGVENNVHMFIQLLLWSQRQLVSTERVLKLAKKLEGNM